MTIFVLGWVPLLLQKCVCARRLCYSQPTFVVLQLERSEIVSVENFSLENSDLSRGLERIISVQERLILSLTIACSYVGQVGESTVK